MSWENRLKDLEKERDTQVTRIFWLCLEIAIILLIPATIAVLIGKYYLPSLKYLLLVFSFIISWVTIIFRYRQISKKMNKIDSEIKELRKEHGIENKEFTDNYQKELDEKEFEEKNEK